METNLKTKINTMFQMLDDLIDTIKLKNMHLIFGKKLENSLILF